MAKNALPKATVLLTTAIKVAAPRTSLTDAQIRLAETLKSIEHWLSNPGVRRLVVCDGSGFDLGRHLIGSPNMEVMSFTNNIEEVAKRGKGFGEGEIVSYALSNSEFLRDEEFFAKCTGKLWVSNFERCLRGFNGVAAFDYGGWLNPLYVDTRFYVVDKNFYRDVLSAVHKEVDDVAGYYLEHAFAKALSPKRLSEYVMYPTPRIHGVSGSTGDAYRLDLPKLLCRDARSWLVKKIR